MAAPKDDRAKWAVVFNPRAGRNGRIRENRLKSALHKGGLDFLWISQNNKDKAADDIGKALSNGIRRILAVGGDGTNNQTINTVASLVSLDEVVYALLPWGTGNDWAASLSLTQNTGQLVSRMMDPRLKDVTLGRISFDGVNKHLFTNTLGIGFDAFVVNRLQDSGKIGKVSYILEIVRSIGSYDSHDVLWTLEKGPERGRIFSLHIGLGPTTGGGMKITPHAIDRGDQLAYTIVMDAPKREYLMAIPNLLTGKIEGLPFTRTGFSPSLSVPGQAVEVLVECDGEISGKAPFTVDLNDRKLQLLDTSV